MLQEHVHPRLLKIDNNLFCSLDLGFGCLRFLFHLENTVLNGVVLKGQWSDDTLMACCMQKPLLYMLIITNMNVFLKQRDEKFVICLNSKCRHLSRTNIFFALGLCQTHV